MPERSWEGRERSCLLALNTARSRFTQDLIAHARQHIGTLKDAAKLAILTRYEGEKQAAASFLKDVAEAKIARKNAGGEIPPDLTPDEKLEILMKGLRREEIYQIAEFYYHLEETDQANPAKMMVFLENHNKYMNHLGDDYTRCIAMGIRPDRIKKAILTPQQIEKVIFLLTASERNGKIRYRAAFDQTILGSLFADTMSREQCRLSVVLLEEFGLLKRHRIQSVEVISDGKIEGYFRAYLKRFLEAFDKSDREALKKLKSEIKEDA